MNKNYPLFEETKISSEMLHKKIMYVAMATFCSIGLQAQNCGGQISDDYSNAALWTTITTPGSGNTGFPFYTQIAKVDSGMARIKSPLENWGAQVYRPLNRTLCDSFVAEIDFTPIFQGNGNSNSFGMVPLALTAGTLHANGVRDANNNYTNSNQDEILVIYTDDGSGSAGVSQRRFSVFIKDGTTRIGLQRSMHISSVVTAGASYRIRLERLGGDFGRLTIINLSDTTLSASVPFVIPLTVGGLSYVQHVNSPTGGRPRVADFSVDNLCITDCNSLSNSDLADFAGLKVFPNPASAYLNVESIKNMAKLELIDLNGRILSVKNAHNSRSLDLDLKNLARGMVILKATFKDGNISTQKIIIE